MAIKGGGDENAGLLSKKGGDTKGKVRGERACPYEKRVRVSVVHREGTDLKGEKA